MKLHYQIIAGWSPEDEMYVARVPALRTVIGFGETYEKAIKEAEKAAKIWLKVAQEEGKTIPKPNATTERLSQLSNLLNMTFLAKTAGIRVTTLNSKLLRGTPLTEQESTSIAAVLEGYGVR